MKSLFALLFAVMLSPMSYAAGVNVTVSPATPIVFNSVVSFPNGVTIYPPWFQAKYNISTDQDITITTLRLTVSHTNSPTMVTDVALPQAVEIPANTSFDTQPVFLGQLPPASDTLYNVQVELIGWYGTANKPVNRLSAGAVFQTQ